MLHVAQGGSTCLTVNQEMIGVVKFCLSQGMADKNIAAAIIIPCAAHARTACHLYGSEVRDCCIALSLMLHACHSTL